MRDSLSQHPSRNKLRSYAPVIAKSHDKTTALQTDVKQYFRDPYILDFLNLATASVLERERRLTPDAE